MEGTIERHIMDQFLQHFFEFGMLFCFGFSWPFSIAKALRTKEVRGKSPLFMCIVIIGYLLGITHKFLHSRDWVIYVYIIDILLVVTDLSIYFHYMRKNNAVSQK